MKLDKTVDNKKIFQKPNGDNVIDLTEQNFQPGEFIKIIDYIIVTDDLSMRPDLIAVAAYQDITAVDVILKQNEISNPFSIDKDDVIFLQERRVIDDQFTSLNKISNKNKVRNQYVDQSKSPTIDGNLTKFTKRQKPKDTIHKSVALPPNFANFGDKEIKFSGGKVIFGGDISSTKKVSGEKTLSKSEFLKKLSKNNKELKKIKVTKIETLMDKNTGK